MTFTLAAASPLNFQDFTVNSKVMVTAFGMELNAGVETYKVLLQGSPTSSATACQYTPATGVTAFIKSVHLYNSDTIDHQVRMYLGGSTAATAVTSTTWIPAGGFAVWGEHGWNVYNATGQRLIAIAGLSIPYNGAATATRLTYNFDTSTSAGSGTGNFRYSNTLTANSDSDIMSVYVAYVDNAGVDRSAFWRQLLAADPRVRTTITVMMTDATDILRTARLRVTSVTDNTTYFTVSCVMENLVSGGLPTLSTSCILQVDSGPPRPLSPMTLGNGLQGLPGFDVVSMATLALSTSAQAIFLPFYTEVPIRFRTFCMINPAQASSGANIRVGVWRAKLQTTAAPRLGTKLLDSLFTAALTGTGLKNLSPALTLQPGYYWLGIAYGALGGSPSVTALYGHYNNSLNLNANQGTPAFSTGWGITGTDYVSAGALPAENTALNSVTASNVAAAIGNQTPLPFWMDYFPLP